MRAPALLECVAAMAASHRLAPVLAGQNSVRPGAEEILLTVAGEMQRPVEGPEEWQLGHKWVANLKKYMPHCCTSC